MAPQGPRIYVYKITFEEVPYYYYGVHKEKRFNEEYWGSPKTHKWCWELYTPKKQILEFFEFSDEGWIEAQEVEKRLITPVLNDARCLNEHVGGIISLEMRRKGAKKTKELGIGIHGKPKEQMLEDCKKGAKKAKELGVGIFGLTIEQLSENGKKGAKIGAKIAAKKAKELGVGIFALSTEQLSENGKKGCKETNSQKWKCTETGYVSTSGPLTRYQRARGINTSKRIRIS